MTEKKARRHCKNCKHLRIYAGGGDFCYEKRITVAEKNLAYQCKDYEYAANKKTVKSQYRK
ncbi:unnamed protein product [marine sediment metagenome]|uniref:Uncharacterized protein n=1 Tax=marine sediment metagenome TaxID=412755 RepID=X0T1B3_9ZZZZ